MGNFRRNQRGQNRILFTKKSFKKVMIFFFMLIILTGIILGIRVIITRFSVKKQEKERMLTQSEIFNQTVKNAETTEEEKISKVTVRLTAIGDILCPSSLSEDAHDIASGEYDFYGKMKAIETYTRKSEAVLTTLGTNVQIGIDTQKKGNIVPEKLVEDMKKVGINFVNTATPNSYIQGAPGVVNTKAALEKNEITVVGTKLQQDKKDYIIKNIRNIPFAFLAYTEGLENTKNIEEASEYINIAEEEKIRNDIKAAKEEGAEFIVVNMYWEKGKDTSVTSKQQEWVDMLIDAGANVILGNNSSGIQKMEMKENSEGEPVLVVYSLGSFLSQNEIVMNKKKRGTIDPNVELLVQFDVEKEIASGKVSLVKVTYTPLYLVDNGEKEKERYELFDIKETLKKAEKQEEKIDEKLQNQFKKALRQLEELIKTE